jgi:hypothetical protein
MIRKDLFIYLFLFSLLYTFSSEKISSASALDRKKTFRSHEIIVDQVFPNSPAKSGGLKSGDKVLAVNGETVLSYEQFLGILKRTSVGKRTIFTILRNKQKIKITMIPRKGRYRFGFSFHPRDPEIAQQLEFDIWPVRLNPNYRKFTVLYRIASSINSNGQSPQAKVLHHIKEVLVNKRYVFTENREDAHFFVKTKFKNSKSESTSVRMQKKDAVPLTPNQQRGLIPFARNKNKRITSLTRVQKNNQIPFEAFGILFLDKFDEQPFLKVSGALNQEKARKYGVKGHVFSMVDAMLEKFPPYKD